MKVKDYPVSFFFQTLQVWLCESVCRFSLNEPLTADIIGFCEKCVLSEYDHLFLLDMKLKFPFKLPILVC